MMDTGQSKSTNVVVHVVCGCDREPLLQVLEEVARKEKWQIGRCLRDCADQSIFFAICSNGGVAGGMQLVLPAADGSLPFTNVWPDLALESRFGCAEIAILAL